MNPLPHALRQVQVLDTDGRRPIRDRLRIVRQDRPPLGAAQVRVGLLAMPVHPADGLQIDGRYGVHPPLPFVPGHEGVGVVLEHATDVTDLPVGSRVLAMGAGGFWCDERILHRRALWPLPAEGEVQQQAMLGANPATAWVLLRHLVALEPGRWVLQNAANSAVGQCVRQLAPLLGLKLINVVRRLDAVPPAAEADQVWIVDDGLAPEAFRDRVVEAVGDVTAGLALDAVGGTASASLAAALGDGGTLVVYGLLSGRSSELPAHDLVFRGVQVRGFWLARWFADPAHRTAARELFPQLLVWARQGRLQMSVQSVHDLDQVAQALEEAARPRRSGKVLLTGAWFGREGT
jgi:NADPH:quinone reductase-like Zn-dependent oxidoreductase